jgi:hypothetical protein
VVLDLRVIGEDLPDDLFGEDLVAGPVATSIGGRRSPRNSSIALKTGTWFRMSYSRSLGPASRHKC